MKPIFLWILLAGMGSAAYAHTEAPDCTSIADTYCSFREPVVITQGASAEITTASQQKVDFSLTVETRQHLADETGETGDFEQYCPDKKCTCEEKIQYIFFKGDGSGIAAINNKEKREAGEYKCSIDDVFVQRVPNYIYTSPTLISTAVFNESYCRGCGGGCHGNTVLTTYNTATGQAYKVKDIVAEKDIPAVMQALSDNFMEHHTRPHVEMLMRDRPDINREEELARISKSLKEEMASENIPDAGIYVENGKVFTSVGGFALGCVNGAFHPVEIPSRFIDASFLALLQTK